MKDVLIWVLGIVSGVALAILFPIKWLLAVVLCGQLIDVTTWLRKRWRRKLWKTRRES